MFQWNSTTCLLCFFLFCIWQLDVSAQIKEAEAHQKIQSLLEIEGLINIEFRITEIDLSNSEGEPTYIYYQQTFDGIDIYKAVGVYAYSIYGNYLSSDRLIAHPSISQSSIDKVTISAKEALKSVVTYLDIPLSSALGRWYKSDQEGYSVSDLPYARYDIEIKPVWYVDTQGLIRSWQMEFAPSINSDHWDVVINGQEGTILEKANQTQYCRFDYHDHVSNTDLKPTEEKFACDHKAIEINDGSAYRVWAPPIESPDRGERTLETEPADSIASPFGWHDINGRTGADFETLRGNNVYAYEDTSGRDRPFGIQPKPEQSLQFDFPFDPEKSLSDNIPADLTNLFYWNNYIHDWSYLLGFDEAAGNFQNNNYTNQGRDGDEIYAETLDGSDINNASFSSPRDGSNGRMQMFKWILAGQFELLSPNDIAGAFNTGSATFGPSDSETISGKLVIVDDSVGETTDACESIRNGSEINGNIALIDRGTCDFSFKVFQAQNAGAIACIICNNEDDSSLITMSRGKNADDVKIPSRFLTKEDCQLIRSSMTENTVIGQLNENSELSSALDNSIVAHEFGHGISLRLVGGPNNSSCLNNYEQMGEGWSDFIGVVLTQELDDQPSTPRPIGTYVLGETREEGNGIRRYPYSTDMAINPQIQSHIRYSDGLHDLGEIWAVTLWDLYWDYIDLYGYDPTWSEDNSGNAMVLRTIFTGMRLQECDASLLEARDGILAADDILTSGNNRCMIWRAFARRGMGEDATAGNPNDYGDNVDGFKVPKSCFDSVFIDKSMTSIIDPGDVISVQIELSNHLEDLKDILVVDQIPENTSIIDLPDGANMNGNQIIIQIDQLDKGQTESINYKLNTDDLIMAEFTIFDNFESTELFKVDRTNSGVNFWRYVSSGDNQRGTILKVNVDTVGGESYAVLDVPILINKESNIFKFDHRYQMDLGIDGGIVQISIDGGVNWLSVNPDDFLINGYTDEISNCFSNCPYPDYFYRNVTPAYTGTDGWRTSVIDFDKYTDETVLIRFNYTSLLYDENLVDFGWAIDNVSFFEKKKLDTEIILTDQSEQVISRGNAFTIIDTDAQTTNTTEVSSLEHIVHIGPNPTREYLSVYIVSEKKSNGFIKIFDATGKLAHLQEVSLPKGESEWNIPVQSFLSGTYFLELTTDIFQKSMHTFIKVD